MTNKLPFNVPSQQQDNIYGKNEYEYNIPSNNMNGGNIGNSAA
jgi:hypothetical protein